MAMALKADVTRACREAGTAKPIDLVHLSNQTMGDRELEREILKLFAAQIPHYCEMAKAAVSKPDVARVAHTIKGAAKSVGAGHLSQIALQAEESSKFDMPALSAEFDKVTRYISELCTDK